MAKIAPEARKSERIRHFRNRLPFFTKIPGVLLTVLLSLSLAWATEKPTASQLQAYAKDGSLNSRVNSALALGNHIAAPDLVRGFRAQIERNRQQRAARGDAPKSRGPVALPFSRHLLQSKGAVKVFALLISFPDYPASQSAESIASRLFGEGDDGWPYESLRSFYLRSSYNMLDINGDVLGWYTAPFTRAGMPQTAEARGNLIKEALLSYELQGHDFAQYDNDGDGRIDYFMVIWTGPDNGWGGFWWGYQTSLSDQSIALDGKGLNQTQYAWLRDSRPDEPAFSPRAAIHETGHALGLPDYYDYAEQAGPRGGIGGIDMMDGEQGDHNPFSKMLLGWISPQVPSSGSREFVLASAGTSQDALLVAPDLSISSPNDEYFLVQNRFRAGNDFYLPGDGLLIWHVDARVMADGCFRNDNSLTSRRLLSLIEGDGRAHILEGYPASPADYFVEGQSLELRIDSSNSAVSAAPAIYGIGPAGQTQSFILDTLRLAPVEPTSPIQGTEISGTTLAALSVGMAAAASGSTYYVDATFGSDSNSGLGTDKPWKTINKVNSSTFLPGDTILFSKGQTWREKLTVPSSGSEGSPITFGAYGTGDKPRILGSTRLSNWTPLSGNIWVCPYAAVPALLAFDVSGAAHYGILKTSYSSCTAEYDWYADGTNVYCFAPADPDARYTSVEASVRAMAIDCNDKAYIYVRDLELAYPSSLGVGIDSNAARNWTIDGCLIHHCGALGAANNAACVFSRASNTVVQNCVIHNGGRHGVTIHTYGGIAVQNCNTINNVIYDCYHTHIDYMNISGTFSGHTIARNRCYNTSSYASTTLTCVGIYVSGTDAAVNCSIEYNIVYNVTGAGIGFGGRVTNSRILNNVVYRSLPGWTGWGEGIYFTGGSVSGAIVKNNISVGPFVGSSSCFRVEGASTQLASCDNNCWYNTGTNRYAIVNSVNYRSTDRAAYMDGTGFDAKGKWEDPRFVSAPTYDFLLLSGSPCRGAGADVGLFVDHAGNPVPAWAGKTPDIGAYEHVPESSIMVATIATLGPSNITTTGATGGGTVFSDGGATVTERGTCWALTANPTVSGPHTHDGSGTGSYTSSMTGLTPGTTYHIRGYATNSKGTAYGSDMAFTTAQEIVPPAVLSSAATSVMPTAATGGGNVYSDGGAAVTERGTCWALTAYPTVSGSHTHDGSGTGSYTSSLTGLTPGTTYHVRAYATNSSGTAYGSDVAFTTPQQTTLPSVSTSAAVSIIATGASSGGTVISDGGATVTARGICWALTANPTVSGSHTHDGSGTGSFTSSLTGLTPGTTYHVRAYATNSLGTVYGNDITFKSTVQRIVQESLKEKKPAPRIIPRKTN